MIHITYFELVVFISVLWIAARAVVWIKKRRIDVKREIQLLFVYICIVVVARFTFFPFRKIDGVIQPLIFDTTRIFPPRLNFVPFIYLFDYETMREALINLIGNTAMFIPLGIVWPSVFRQLDSHIKVITAGFCTSLCIELLQLPFFDRVSDIDDLILNTLGFASGYGIYLLVRKICRLINRTRK